MNPPANTDDKAEALKKHRALNPQPEEVADELFQADDFFDPRDLVQVKYEMVRRVREAGDTVTDAAMSFGFSRQTFYQAQDTLAQEGLAGLVPKRPGPRRAHKLSAEVMEFADRLLDETPALGSEELARRIEERFGVSVHPRSIERALARQGK